MALDQHAVVVAERGDEGGGHLVGGGREADAERRALAGGLDDERQAELRFDFEERVGRAELAERRGAEGDPVGGRDPRLAHPVLGLDLVDAEHARGNAGAGVGDPQQLEQRLDRSVLASGPVQGDEGDVRPLGLEPADQALVGIDRDDLVAERTDGILDPGAGAHRDGPLERASAHQDRDLHELVPGRRWNGRTSPSGLSGSGPSAAASAPGPGAEGTTG